MDRNFLETIVAFEEQLKSTQEQFRALKEFVAIMMEEHQTLQQENRLLRERLDAIHAEEAKLLQEQKPAAKRDVGEGYDNLARLYQEGFHVCHPQFGSPRKELDCMFCLAFLNKDN